MYLNFDNSSRIAWWFDYFDLSMDKMYSEIGKHFNKTISKFPRILNVTVLFILK